MQQRKSSDIAALRRERDVTLYSGGFNNEVQRQTERKVDGMG